MQVSIEVDEGEITYLDAVVAILLYRKLVQGSTELRRLVGSEPSSRTTELNLENLSYGEVQVEVGEHIERRKGQNVLIR